MGIIGNLSQYAQFQAANALEQAAKNSGGANAGVEMGMGFAMANQMSQIFNQQNSQNQNAPPIPGVAQYFIAVNGQQQGPYSLQVLQQMIQQSSVSRDTLIWKQGMSAWTKAVEVAEVNAFFGVVPPPLPPL